MRRLRLPGAHRVVARVKGGVAIYWYLERGGPRIARFEGVDLAEAVAKEAAAAGDVADAYARGTSRRASTAVLAGFVDAYMAGPQWTGLEASTRKLWSRWLDRIKTDLGAMPVVALKARGARRAIYGWRDQFAATPRAADTALQVLNRVLNWALDRELIEANPAHDMEKLYDKERAAEIVEPHELAEVLKRTTPAAARFFKLAATSGLRRADLARLRWSDVGEHSIELAPRKSRRQGRRVIVPVTDELRAVLAECRAAEDDRLAERRASAKPATRSEFVAVTAKGTPWAEQAVTDAWSDARPPGMTKHLHDLRGTFATLLMAYGFSDGQIADVLGWDHKDVGKIRRRYVDRERVALDMVEQIRRAKAKG